MPGPAVPVAANSTVIYNLPVGMRYKSLLLNWNGSGTFTPALVTAIRLYANNQLFQTYLSGTDRDMFNQHDRMPAATADNVLAIPFGRFGMEDEKARYHSWINTGANSAGAQNNFVPITDFRLEIALGAVVTPSLALHAEVADNNVEQSVYLPRVDTWTETPNVGPGDFIHINTPMRLKGDPKRAMTHRLWMLDTVAHITQMRLIQDGAETQNNLLTTTNDFLLRSTRAPQAGYIALDYGCDGEDKNLLCGADVSTLEFRTTHTAGFASPLTLYQESLGSL